MKECLTWMTNKKTSKIDQKQYNQFKQSKGSCSSHHMYKSPWPMRESDTCLNESN